MAHWLTHLAAWFTDKGSVGNELCRSSAATVSQLYRSCCSWAAGTAEAARPTGQREQLQQLGRLGQLPQVHQLQPLQLVRPLQQLHPLRQLVPRAQLRQRQHMQQLPQLQLLRCWLSVWLRSAPPVLPVRRLE